MPSQFLRFSKLPRSSLLPCLSVATFLSWLHLPSSYLVPARTPLLLPASTKVVSPTSLADPSTPRAGAIVLFVLWWLPVCSYDLPTQVRSPLKMGAFYDCPSRSLASAGHPVASMFLKNGCSHWGPRTCLCGLPTRL